MIGKGKNKHPLEEELLLGTLSENIIEEFVTVEDVKNRRTAKYKRWRLAVFKRDKFTCQKCGSTDKRFLEAHHLKSFVTYPELRHELSNGETLCHTCHEKVHKRKFPCFMKIGKKAEHITPLSF